MKWPVHGQTHSRIRLTSRKVLAAVFFRTGLNSCEMNSTDRETCGKKHVSSS